MSPSNVVIGGRNPLSSVTASAGGSKTSVTYGYNPDNLLTGYVASGGPTFSLSATVDGLGRLTAGGETLTEVSGSSITYDLSYDYDMRSQLTGADYSNLGENGLSWNYNYTYLNNGNMDSRTINSVVYNLAYNGDQMASIDSNTLDYDKNGNMIMGVNNILVYNWDNKLCAALSEVEGSSISLKYDPDGNRVYKESTVDTTTTKRKYIVDRVGDLPTILLELDPMSNYAIRKTYIYGNSQILAQHDGSYTAPRYFYLHDRLGSVRQIINSSGQVVCRYTYDPFGQLHLAETEDNSALCNPFKYTGQYFDSETGLYYFFHRQYDPYLGRFTSYDPIDGKFTEPLSLHKYLYCWNDPVNRIDPTGLWWEITHQEFGDWGWGYNSERGRAPFDYASLDRDYSPFNPRYTWMHFRSREDVYPELMYAAGEGNSKRFEYLMHEWQDAYVHYDRGFRAPWGHARYDLTHKTSADDPRDHINIQNQAYERCDFTTTELEQIWFKYNIDQWINNPLAEIPDVNPWFSTFRYSWLVDF